MSDVEVIITRETAALTQAGFGMPLIVDTGGAVAYAECTSLAEVAATGFVIGTDVYAMATAIFAQSPRPTRIAVVGVATSPVLQATAEMVAGSTAAFSVTATSGLAYDGVAGNGWEVVIVDEGAALDVILNVAARRITVDLGGDTRTAADIVTDIAALTGFESAVTNAGDFTVAADVGRSVTLAGGSGGLLASLDVLIETRNNWYFLLCTDQDTADVIELSAWAAANQKLYFACPDATVSQTIGMDLNSDRTVVVYHHDPGSYPDAAWVGRCAPELPGSITWKFKTLQTISPADVTTTEITDLHAANINTYVQKYGVNQTSEGKTTDGEFIDVMRGQDWVQARIAEGISRLLFTSPKVPYDVRGIALVVAEVEAVMQRAVANGIIAVDEDGNGIYEVTAPDIADIPANDKANRHLPDVRFEFTLAGAIHTVTVRGVIRI